MQSYSNFNDPEGSRTILPDIDFKPINGCGPYLSLLIIIQENVTSQILELL